MPRIVHLQGVLARRKEHVGSPLEDKPHPEHVGYDRPARRENEKAANPRGFAAFRVSGRRGSNPRRPPWQGGTLPLSYSRVVRGVPYEIPWLTARETSAVLDNFRFEMW